MLATQTLKDAWLSALRDHTYQHGRFEFKTPDGAYCCLGVLCMVMKHPEWAQSREGRHNQYDQLRMHSQLTPAETHALVALNDMNDSTFHHIANYIERHITALNS